VTNLVKALISCIAYHVNSLAVTVSDLFCVSGLFKFWPYFIVELCKKSGYLLHNVFIG